MAKRILYVQLEAAAVLSDSDFLMFNAAQRGIYWTIVLHMYCNNGRCTADETQLKRLCNCRNFSRNWPVVKKKFKIKNGCLEHKRVTKELRRVREFMQAQRAYGFKGAAKRWGAYGQPNGEPIANEKRSKEKGKKVNPNPDMSGSDLRAPDVSLKYREHISGFLKELYEKIPPMGIPDRVSFRKMAVWLAKQCEAGKYDLNVFQWALEYANEAVKDGARNPAALFTSIIKSRLGYVVSDQAEKKG